MKFEHILANRQTPVSMQSLFRWTLKLHYILTPKSHHLLVWTGWCNYDVW